MGLVYGCVVGSMRLVGYAVRGIRRLVERGGWWVAVIDLEPINVRE